MPASNSSRGSSQSAAAQSSVRASASESSSGEAASQTKRPGTASSQPASGLAGTGRVSGSAGRADGLTGFAEQLANRIINPLGLVVLTRERIQDTLDEAAARGRLTRSDANELVAELVRRGRQQTEELLSDLERLLGRGRDQLDFATQRAWLSEGMDRIVRTADRARRTVGVGPSLPIIGYDDLTAAQVTARLNGLTPAELRKVREYERRHANRKSVLGAVEHALS